MLNVSKNNIESACLIVVFGSDMTDSMILVYLLRKLKDPGPDSAEVKNKSECNSCTNK